MADLHLYVYGEVIDGLENEIQEQLKQETNPDNIYLHINSPGGGVFTGWTIGNIIKMQGVKTTALIEGFCASIATYIALSCDEVKMADTAQFMIHNAHTGLYEANKNDLREVADQLDKIDKDLIKVYQKKTGLPQERIQEMMNKEMFMSTDEAITLGFVDGKMEALKAVAKFDFDMNNEVESKLSGIEKLLNKLFAKEVKDEATEPSNMALELEDGAMIFVRSEDGELEGKPVVMADAEGNPTEEPAPNGVHMLRDGRSITVEDGMVVSVQEVEPEGMDEEKEEMRKEIEALKAELQAKTEAEELVASRMTAIEDQLNNLSNVTIGTPFKADKPLTQPQNKDVSGATSSGAKNDNSAWGERLKNSYK